MAFTLNQPAPNPLAVPGEITPGSMDFGNMSQSDALGFLSPDMNGPLGQYGGYQPVTNMGQGANGGLMTNLKNLFNGSGNGTGFGSLSGYGDLLGGAAAVFGAYNGYKNMKLAKEQLDFTKKATNRNLANQATVTNEALSSRANARSSFGGKKANTVQVSGAPL